MSDILKRNDELISKAQSEIATILANLETETGQVLESIEVKDIEVTKLSDTREQWRRFVQINMMRRPGTAWGQ